MKTVKMRNISKILLGASVLLIVLRVFFGGFMYEWLSMAIFVAAIVMMVGFVVLTIIFWRCPNCKKPFKMYDLELENTKECPFCGEKFGCSEDEETEQQEELQK